VLAPKQQSRCAREEDAEPDLLLPEYERPPGGWPAATNADWWAPGNLESVTEESDARCMI